MTFITDFFGTAATIPLSAISFPPTLPTPACTQTTSKSIRFPNDVIDEVESVLVGTDCTFSAFVVEAVRVALENLKEESAEDE